MLYATLLLAMLGADIKTGSLYKGLVFDAPLNDEYLQSATVASDRTPYSNHLTIQVGGTFDSTGYTGDGSDTKYLKRDVAGFRDSDQQGTIFGWFNTSGSSGNYYLFSVNDNATADQSYRVLLVSTVSYRIAVGYLNGATNRYLLGSTTGWNDGAWHSFAVTSNGSRTLIYIDGQSETFSEPQDPDDGSWLGDVVSADNVCVGAWCRSGTLVGSDGTFYGTQVYDRELSAAELLTKHNQGRRVIAANTGSLYKGLVMHVPLNDEYQKGALLSDRTPYGYDLTQVNAPTVASTGTTLNGSTQYVWRSMADWRLSDQVGTIFCRVTPAAGNDGVIFSTSDEATDLRFIFLRLLAAGDGRLLRWYTRYDGSYTILESTTAVWADGEESTVAVTSNGSRTLMYHNGSPISFAEASGTDSGTWFADIANRDNVVFGVFKRTATTNYYTGELNGCWIYDRELSAAEMLTKHTQGRRVIAINVSP